MNELMIVLEGGQWIYFPTEEEKADVAFKEFCEKSEMLGINYDNLKFDHIVLRDPKYKDIDSLSFK